MATGGDEKEWERDTAMDYVVQSGTFKGSGSAGVTACCAVACPANIPRTRTA
ncbi:hypothetical protein [Pseudomonas helleri]|uniref:hypothetical protein n=1 Tax=Pseudomonas helleri TaxID=1608996 RepID=UPI003FCF29A1